MSLAIATFRGVLWNHGGKVIEYSLMYAASLVVARGLGVEVNGVYALVTSLSQLLLVLTSFGFETVINKSFSRISGADAGRIVPEADVQALGNALLNLRNDAPLRQPYVKNGLSRASVEYAVPVSGRTIPEAHSFNP
jgi:glycosyltransferase involved in cell wall biosynthesis